MIFKTETNFCTLTASDGKYLYRKADTENIDRTDLETAYAQFREVCSQIQTFAGLTSFKGGFDEAIAFLKSDAFAADKLTGTYLFSLWQGADKAATYEAAKIGIGQPAWWKECWGITA
jgi:hypothetical protein